MRIYKIKAGTKGYKIVWPHVVPTTTKREIIAEAGLSKEPGTFWVTNNPIMKHNGSTSHSPNTIGYQMTDKGYTTIVTYDKNHKEHVLFVPFNEVEII